MTVLFLQPAAHVADLGVDLARFRHAARFGTVNLASLPRTLRDTAVVVNCIDTSVSARYVLLAAAREGVPCVYLFDGIYDVANAYRNPAHRRRRVQQMDPLLYTHVACVDRWTHRTFASLGVRTHAWLPRRAAPETTYSPSTRDASFLVATARTPAFDAAERSRLQRLLALTVESLNRMGATYRFRTGDAKLLASLGIPARHNDVGDGFSRCMSRYDCLVTTPSTIATTAMLAGKPTAMLDYRDSPLTQQTGWRIHASTNIDSTLASMLDPAPDRMTFQAREVAHLANRSPVEDFILQAAGDRSLSAPHHFGHRTGVRLPVSFDYPLRWIYVNLLKPFRKR